MKASEIRQQFLKFFESKGHAVVASSPVIDGNAALEYLQTIEASVFAPARTALAASVVSRVLLRAGHRMIEVVPGARWAFWRRPRPLAESLA